jgi:hypothetical protein
MSHARSSIVSEGMVEGGRGDALLWSDALVSKKSLRAIPMKPPHKPPTLSSQLVRISIHIFFCFVAVICNP